MTYYNILSVEGGGIRGLLSCKLLERLERIFPGYLNKVDLMGAAPDQYLHVWYFRCGRL